MTQKLIAFFVLLIVFPVLLAYWIVSARVASITEQQMGDTLFQLVKTGHLTLDRDITAAGGVTERLMLMTETQRMFDPPSEIEYYRLQQYLALDKVLSESSKHAVGYSVFFPELAEYYPFAPPSGVKPNGVFFDCDTSPGSWFRQAVDAKGAGLILTMDKLGDNPEREQTAAYVRRINNLLNNDKPAGVLVMTGLEQLLQNDLESLKLPDDGQIVLLDPNNVVLSSNAGLKTASVFELPPALAELPTGVHIEKHGKDSWLFAIHTSADSRTKLLFKIPIRSIIGEHEDMRQLVNSLMIVYFGVLLIASLYFFRRFIEMTKRLNRATIDNYHLELKHKEAELSTLHSQINPHLLYNTLESIMWRNTIEGNEESASMIRDLSQLMRIGLSRGKTLIAIAEELKHVEAYLRLQLKRNHYSFRIHWQIEEASRDLLIPKVVLQPLVENAILHGIRKMDRDGELWISVHTAEDRVLIHIEDNGYKPVDLNRLHEILSETRPEEGYGIRNVNKRIKLHFGDAYGIRFESRPEGGLRVTLTIPAVREKD